MYIHRCTYVCKSVHEGLCVIYNSKGFTQGGLDMHVTLIVHVCTYIISCVVAGVHSLPSLPLRLWRHLCCHSPPQEPPPFHLEGPCGFL